MKLPRFIIIPFATASVIASAFGQAPSVSPGSGAKLPADSPAVGAKPATTSSSPSAVTPPKAGAQPSAEEMQKMMELGKPGENHKQLAQLAGDWTYTVKMWM